MNFFCSGAEFDQYVADMELDPELVIKADIDRAVKEAYEIFHTAVSVDDLKRLLAKAIQSNLKGNGTVNKGGLQQ